MNVIYSGLWARSRREGVLRLLVLAVAAGVALGVLAAPSHADTVRGTDIPSAAVAEALRDTAAMEHEDVAVRVAATRSLASLGRNGDGVAESLLGRAARDIRLDWRIRAEALQGLATIDGGRALAREVGPSRPAVVATPRLLVPVGLPVATVDRLLAEALSDPDVRVRRLAALASVGDDVRTVALATALGSALDDEDASVRALASRALGHRSVGQVCCAGAWPVLVEERTWVE
jgi:HEAT repeat protein